MKQYKSFVLEFTKAARDEFIGSMPRWKNSSLETHIANKCKNAFTAMDRSNWLGLNIDVRANDLTAKANPSSTPFSIKLCFSQDALSLKERRCSPWPAKTDEGFIKDRLNEYLSINKRGQIYVQAVRLA